MTDTFLKTQLIQMVSMTKAPDQAVAEKVRVRLNQLGKPIGSFGRLEEMITRMAAVKGDEEAVFDKKALLVLCGDHGVVREGVTQTDSSVTRIVADNLAAGRGAASLLARRAGVDVFVADLGMYGEPYGNKTLGTGYVIDRRVGSGAGNIFLEPAMTEDDCLKAILQGILLTEELAARDYQMIGLGEMGIGNTTPSSALASVMMDLPADEVTGRGAGLSKDAWRRKTGIVEMSVARYWDEARDIEDGPYFKLEAGIELLAQLGGYELAGLCGVIIGGAIYGIPVVLDGLITMASALAATLICPACKESLFASHLPAEPAGSRILKMLHTLPVIDAVMSQGEGTGALMAMQLLDDMLLIYHELPTFEAINVPAYTDYKETEK